MRARRARHEQNMRGMRGKLLTVKLAGELFKVGINVNLNGILRGLKKR